MQNTLLAAILLLAGSGDESLSPQCGGAFQLCGYVESGGDTLRISRRFEVAEPFSEGLAAVRIDGRYGFVDLSGDLVIQPRYSAAGSFSGGYAEVQEEGVSGIIDSRGRFVVRPQFHRITPLSGDTFVAVPLREHQRPPSSMMPWRARPLEGISDVSWQVSRDRAGLYHADQGWLTDQDLQFGVFDNPERGLIWAGRRNEHGDTEWGLLQADGTWQVTPRYAYVQRLSEGRALVRSMRDYSLSPVEGRAAQRWGAVDRYGELVIPLEFIHLFAWRSGYGRALDRPRTGPDGTSNTVREGIVRPDGSLLADRYFDEVDLSREGNLPRARLGDTWHSVEPDGRLIADQLDGQPLVECENGLTILRRGEQVEFSLPAEDRTVGRFDNRFFRQRDCPGPFVAQRGQGSFFILEDGTVLGGQSGFENTYSFSSTHVAVLANGKWGVIDRSGNYTVEPIHDSLRPDRNGTFAIGEGDDTYWIDANGNRVEQPEVARPTPEQALTCQGGLRFFKRDSLWGLQDETGRTVIQPRYRALSCFHQGVSWTVRPGGSAWCPVGPDGRARDSLECRPTYYSMIVTESGPERFDEDPFESNVLWNRAWLDYLAGDRADPPRWISRYERQQM